MLDYGEMWMLCLKKSWKIKCFFPLECVRVYFISPPSFLPWEAWWTHDKGSGLWSNWALRQRWLWCNPILSRGSELGVGCRKLWNYWLNTISKLHFPSVSKRVFVQNHSYENVFHQHVYIHANQAHFHMERFSRRLILKQRQMTTRKWSIHAAESHLGLASVSLVERTYNNELVGGVWRRLPRPQLQPG